MNIDVAWVVRGASSVEITEQELKVAIAAGIDPEDGDALFCWLDDNADGDVRGDLVSDWYERDLPELIQADFYPPDWAVEAYAEKENK